MDYEKKYKGALERANQIRNGNPSSGTAIVVCEQIFPELKESEDERIRKEIINFLRSPFVNENITDEKVAPWLSWLEKQKEHVPENEKSGTRKEQKPYCPSNDELEKAAKEFREKNVPPIEPISDELVEIIKDEFEGFRRLLKKKGIDYEPQRSYWEGFARLFDSSAREYVKEQKPAWSEEDKQFLLVCKNALSKYQQSDKWDADIIYKWLVERIKSYNAQQKPEWSKEDKETIDLLIGILKVNHPNGKFKTTEAGTIDVKYISTEEIISRLESLCPSWKPSEEQIAVLWDAISNLKHDGYKKIDTLIFLYEQLKSL